MRLFWSDRALADRTAIFNYINADSPQAAAQLDGKFVKAAERLIAHPYLARPGRLAGTRELVVTPNYILIYRIAADDIGIVRVLHAARQWPPEE